MSSTVSGYPYGTGIISCYHPRISHTPHNYGVPWAEWGNGESGFNKWRSRRSPHSPDPSREGKPRLREPSKHVWVKKDSVEHLDRHLIYPNIVDIPVCGLGTAAMCR